MDGNAIDFRDRLQDALHGKRGASARYAELAVHKTGLISFLKIGDGMLNAVDNRGGSLPEMSKYVASSRDQFSAATQIGATAAINPAVSPQYDLGDPIAARTKPTTPRLSGKTLDT
jgi:hypothetical protein